MQMWILSAISVLYFLSPRGLLCMEKWLLLLLSSASRCRDWSGLWSRNSKWISFLFCPCFQRNMFLLAFAIEILFPALHFMLMRCHVFCEMGWYRLSKRSWGGHVVDFSCERRLCDFTIARGELYEKKNDKISFWSLQNEKKIISKQ